ncbi:MAG: UvrD-helicase domain-containing protein [Muribaculaceae bacterium]|nr:UvrD-helicase domain-containing protein [Muribaculaceae bacterium]
MLTIQRASAGSGKTYTLARTFLVYFLTIPVSPDKIPDPATKEIPRRLRTGAELLDSLNHILAVTFTNKATAEMKTRIVEKLYAIASHTPGSSKRPDYLSEISKLTSSSEEEVVAAARTALRILLFDFSSFNVSTIDSFFQNVLRTFAYEVDLNDSYQLEIDSALTSVVGVDETLDSIISGKSDPQTDGWLKLLMEDSLSNGENWNPFQRRDSRRSVYSNLINNAKRMEAESFKEITSTLESFFKTNTDLLATYKKIDSYFFDVISALNSSLRTAAKDLADEFGRLGLSLKDDGAQYLESRLKKSIHHNSLTGLPFEAKALGKTPFKANKCPSDKDAAALLQSLYDEWKDIYDNLKVRHEDPDFRLWNVYRILFPYIPLLNTISHNIRQYLADTNTMQLSDTNTLLFKIIGNSDTPFIYERLGTRVNHYLIDEFQDTSRLQWKNFAPLLKESIAQNNENLIIGDAKQSIYRFRNADPSIITSAVPSSFPNHKAAGDTRNENTNWRSQRNIVQFNNLFFYALSSMLSEETGFNFRHLYSNVIQYPQKQKNIGFVNVTFFKNKSSDSFPSHFSRAGEMVKSLLDRGYHRKDIAFLVLRRDEGTAIAQALIDYNASLSSEDEHIEFISDESLLVGEANAVKTVISILRAIAQGDFTNKTVEKADPEELPTGPENSESHTAAVNVRSSVKWYAISSRFSYLAARYPQKSPLEIIESILAGEDDESLLLELLSKMQSVALPSLVEALIETFVSEKFKKTEVAFIAAFQDIVLSYCETNPSDIASFLDWWERKGTSLSITSPEEMDAVKIMTIHKSKGLEFPCVIIPNANMAFKPSPHKTEWAWISPDDSFLQSRGEDWAVVKQSTDNEDKIPLYLPVMVDSNLENTPHADLWKERCRLVAMDSLNSAYVAYTRAVNELYIFSPVIENVRKKAKSELHDKDEKDAELPNPMELSLRRDGKMGEMAYSIFREWNSYLSEASRNPGVTPDEIPVNPLEIHTPENPETDPFPVLTLGSPLTAEEITAFHSKEEEKRREEDNHYGIRITEYKVNSNRSILKYKNTDLPENNGEDEEEDNDPRSEGNIRHLIMENVYSASDLHRAVEKVRLRGLLSRKEAGKEEEFLKGAIDSVGHLGWFDSSVRVLNERWTIKETGARFRPDRMIVDKEGNLTIIDYKFGSHTNVSKYRSQLRNYISILTKTEQFKSVKGYLWYVAAGKVEEVNLLTSDKNKSR